MKLREIRFDYNYALAAAVGKSHGLYPAEIAGHASKAGEIHGKIARDHRAGRLPFLDLPGISVHAEEAAAYAKKRRGAFDNFVVLGIGGSALGNIALQGALNGLYYNETGARGRNGFPRIYVPDNSDPDLLGELLDTLDLRRTLFNVVTKSGSTAETLSQYLVVRRALDKAVSVRSARRHVVVTTDAKKGPLRKIAEAEGLDSFCVPDGVGGRFTILTPVGLLSAAFGGIDVRSLLAGAASMKHRAFRRDVLKSPAYLNGLIHYLLDVKKGKSISVMMPYSNHLFRVADWYRQLWAESLGKRFSVDKREVFAGQTPIHALGATDQHSQLQLYMEGPFDKVFTFLQVEKFRKEIKIPRLYPGEEALNYLGGKTLGTLINAELLGTEYALKEANRPSVKVVLPVISPYTVGQLLFMYELQTVFAGGLYGVDPLDQPGVEASKIATYTLMGRKGYAGRAAALRAGMKKESRFII